MCIFFSLCRIYLIFQYSDFKLKFKHTTCHMHWRQNCSNLIFVYITKLIKFLVDVVYLWNNNIKIHVHVFVVSIIALINFNIAYHFKEQLKSKHIWSCDKAKTHIGYRYSDVVLIWEIITSNFNILLYTVGKTDTAYACMQFY